MRAFKRLTTLFTRRQPQPDFMPAEPSKLSRALNPWGALRAEREATSTLMALAADMVEQAGDEITRLRTATCELADLFNDGMLADSLAERLTCSEAEQLAQFFRTVDRPHVADLWLECHATGDDDEEDLHYQGERSEPVELALAS